MSDRNSNQVPLEGAVLSAGSPLWRSQLVRFLEVLGVLAMFLGGAEFLNLLNALPQGVAPQWAFLIGGVVNKTAKPVIEFFGDWFDDGEFNKSFKIGPLSVLFLIGALAVCVGMSSCAGIYSGVTGQPIPVEPVTTKDKATFNVATSDVLRAKESPPETAWGLYNAGLVARRASEVIDAGK